MDSALRFFYIQYRSPPCCVYVKWCITYVLPWALLESLINSVFFLACKIVQLIIHRRRITKSLKWTVLWDSFIFNVGLPLVVFTLNGVYLRPSLWALFGIIISTLINTVFFLACNKVQLIIYRRESQRVWNRQCSQILLHVCMREPF